jgi:hypothetical protein
MDRCTTGEFRPTGCVKHVCVCACVYVCVSVYACVSVCDGQAAATSELSLTPWEFEAWNHHVQFNFTI